MFPITATIYEAISIYQTLFKLRDLINLTPIGISTIRIQTQEKLRHREFTFHSGSNIQTQEPGNQHN